MGSMFSSSDSGFSASQLQKVAGPPPPPKCSTEQACKLEAQDVDGLEQMIKLEEELDKKLPISSNLFDEYWDSIKENNQFLSVTGAPTFLEERVQVRTAFEGDDFFKKQEVSKEFKMAVDFYLEKLASKNAKEEAPPDDVKQTKAQSKKK